MIGATNFVGVVEGELVCHVAVSTAWVGRGVAARACRLVVMPQWQGAGVGLRFLAAVCERMRSGENRWRRPLVTYFHTSHPGLCEALRRTPAWVQVSCSLYGGDKARSMQSIAKAADRRGTRKPGSGYGGHFRAVQGFKYVGEKPIAKGGV
jgi:GNAT superfamily N-acetyltransferase